MVSLGSGTPSFADRSLTLLAPAPSISVDLKPSPTKRTMSQENESVAVNASPTAAAAPGATETAAPKRLRGFAALDTAARSEISRKGGQAAHRAGTAHKFTTDEARAAGKKGSQVTHARRRAEVVGST